jgi:hypothetical protein
MKRRQWGRLSAILALTTVAVVAVLLGPLSSAVGFFSGGLSLDVQIQSPATLLSRGAAINVPLQVVCTSQQADVFVQVTQRAGSEIAQGFGFKTITCEGDLQAVNVTVSANSGKAFKKGTAVAQAEIFGCLRFCGSESDTAEIAIAKSGH